MTHFNFTFLGNYKNHGQNTEQSIRHALTGRIEKADNIKHSVSADCLGYQIKAAKASVCKGTNIEKYLDEDKATGYIYGTRDGIAYEMNRAEYTEFLIEFGYITRESKKNGGGEKIRLKDESKKMLQWLEVRAI